MSKIQAQTVRAFEYKGGVDGLKTILGVAAIVIGHLIAAAAEVQPQFPDSALMVEIQTVLQQAADYVGQGVMYLGGGFTIYGLWDKIKKFFGFGK